MAGHDTVSVVIPTYNRAEHLAATVASALAQSHPPAEVIVVDDGSTDGTEAVARSLPPAVRYCRQANAGVSAARNAGAALARGQWLAFLDCEDAWEPTKLATQLAAHGRHPTAQWSVTDCIVVEEDDRPRVGRQGFRAVFARFREDGLAPEEVFGTWLEPDASGGARAYVGDLFGLLFEGNVCLPSTALVRRDAFERTGGFNPAWRGVAEDTEFFHRLAARAPGMVLMAPLTRYRAAHAGSLSSSPHTTALVRGGLRSVDQAAMLRIPLSPAERAALDRGRARLIRRLAWSHLANFEPRAARIALAEYRAAGGPWDAALLGWHALALLPAPVLRALHAAKRAFAGRRPA